MTVLVDEARWPWRGERWAHLCSDHDLDELHHFARRLGLRRLAFQGDHYDVTEAQRELAIVLGAEPVPARTLVRRLRAAGLRRREAGRSSWRWQLVEAGEARGVDADELVRAITAAGDRAKLGTGGSDGRTGSFTAAARSLAADIGARIPPHSAVEVRVLARSGEVGIMVRASPSSVVVEALITADGRADVVS